MTTSLKPFFLQSVFIIFVIIKGMRYVRDRFVFTNYIFLYTLDDMYKFICFFYLISRQYISTLAYLIPRDTPHPHFAVYEIAKVCFFLPKHFVGLVFLMFWVDLMAMICLIFGYLIWINFWEVLIGIKKKIGKRKAGTYL